MIVLALDTCLNACSAALVKDGEPLAAASEPMARGHQERLAPMIEAMMRDVGAGFEVVDRIAVTLGPGSFTGLRVGVAFAKGLALALDRPLAGVGALEALAASAPREGLALAVVDARRAQAYWQPFLAGAPLADPGAWTVADIADWAIEHGRPQALIGPGAALLAARFPGAEAIDLGGPDPVAVARLGAAREPGRVQPIYLRTPDAKLPGGVEPNW